MVLYTQCKITRFQFLFPHGMDVGESLIYKELMQFILCKHTRKILRRF